MNSEKIINQLNLVPLEREGGWVKEFGKSGSGGSSSIIPHMIKPIFINSYFMPRCHVPCFNKIINRGGTTRPRLSKLFHPTSLPLQRHFVHFSFFSHPQILEL